MITQLPEVLGRSSHIPNGGGEEHQGQDKQPSGEDIAQRTQEQQPRGISGLGQGGDQAGSFIAHTELLGQDMQDRVVVIEIGDGESAGEGEQEVQPDGEGRGIGRIIATSLRGVKDEGPYGRPLGGRWSG